MGARLISTPLPAASRLETKSPLKHEEKSESCVQHCGTIQDISDFGFFSSCLMMDNNTFVVIYMNLAQQTKSVVLAGLGSSITKANSKTKTPIYY